MVRNHIMKSNLNFHTYTISKNIFEGGTDDNRYNVMKFIFLRNSFFFIKYILEVELKTRPLNNKEQQ